MPLDARPSIVADLACACGRVSLHVRGRVKAMFMCACRDCQRATGTGHSTVAAFATADVSVAGGIGGFDVTADSGARTTRWFCPACGTPLFARSSRAPDLTLVPVGLFGEVDWFVPKQVIFARSHLDWDVLPPGIPKWNTYPDAEPAGGRQLRK